MGKEQKRFQKKKERERAVARKLLLQRAHKYYADAYPVFIFDKEFTEGAPDTFVKAVRLATKRIRFDNDELFSSLEQEAYRLVKKEGNRFIEGWLERAENNVVSGQALSVYMIKVGAVIFDLIGESHLLKWIPFHDVRFLPCNGDFVVQFRSLEQKSVPGGTIYYSSRKPKLTVDGKSKIVGFSTHAIQQVCSRIVPGWRTYGGLGDAFAIFEQCNHFEVAGMVEQQLAFTLYDSCVRGFFSWNYVKELIGGEPKSDGNYYYRVGYCPSVVEGEFVKAKTLLCPGYYGTPEYDIMMHSLLTKEQRTEMQEQIRQFSVEKLRESGDFSIPRWFHNNGVPQVVWSKDKWYHA
jgi:hypothetical protein